MRAVADRLSRAVLGWMHHLPGRIARATSHRGITYYVAPTGDDGNAGASPDAPWLSLARASRHRFGPGDRLLLQGAQQFAGPLSLGADSVGSPDRPIVIGSFGTGRATIRVASGSGVLFRNIGGVRISNINVVGGRRGSDIDSGIAIRNGLPGNVRLAYVRIDHVEVSGFTGDGIAIGGLANRSGFRDVVIEHVSVHDNARSGITVFGEWSQTSKDYANEKVVLRFVAAYNNSGIEGPHRPHSGSGIVLSDVNHGLIERCVAFNNGWLSDSLEGGPIGIWVHDANDITIQHNESYANRTGGVHDGGGFDLDGGVTNSVLQGNYSHDNDGAGYLLAQYDNARPFGRNVVRYNISQNDGRKNAYGAIHGFGDLASTDIHNNTVYLEPAEFGQPAAIVFAEGAKTGIRVMNNIFQTAAGLSCLRVASPDGPMFLGNDYYSGGGPLAISWQSVSYDSLAAWRAATGQERLGQVDVGLSVDPRLRAPGGDGTLGASPLIETLDAYELTAASPLIGAGLDLESIGVDPGPRVSPLDPRVVHGSDIGARPHRRASAASP